MLLFDCSCQLLTVWIFCEDWIACKDRLRLALFVDCGHFELVEMARLEALCCSIATGSLQIVRCFKDCFIPSVDVYLPCML